MKEATGELNMTVVTLIAVAAVGALFYFAIWPMVQRMLVQQTCNTYGVDYVATKVEGEAEVVNGGTEVHKWECCNEKTNKCIAAD